MDRGRCCRGHPLLEIATKLVTDARLAVPPILPSVEQIFAVAALLVVVVGVRWFLLQQGRWSREWYGMSGPAPLRPQIARACRSAMNFLRRGRR